MPFGMEVGLVAGEIVIDGDPVPLPKRGTPAPNFWPMYCGWIKMPLGMEVGLGPGDIVLDRDRVFLPKKRGMPPIFGPWFYRTTSQPIT